MRKIKIRTTELSVLTGSFIVLLLFGFPDTSPIRDVNAQSPGGESGAAKQCRYCPPDFCYNPESARLLKKQLENKLRHRGIPDRLLVFVDRLPDCPACIRSAPRDFFIGWRIDPEVYERVEGVPAPRVTHGSTRWSRTAEKIARDRMKEGVYSEFHIIHKAGKPCECCVDTSPDSYTEWRDRDERPDEDHPNYDEDFESTPESMISYRDLGQLGPDPADLTEIPPLYRRPTDPKVPPADEFMDEPAMRFVQVICDRCRGLADRYNALGDEYNALRELLAELRQTLHEARQMAIWIDREIQGLELTIPSPDKQRRMEELYGERNRYINDANRLTSELRTHETRRDELQAGSSALLEELKTCEAGCLEVEKPTGLKPVPARDIGSQSEKPVPDKEDVPNRSESKSDLTSGLSRSQDRRARVQSRMGDNPRPGSAMISLDQDQPASEDDAPEEADEKETNSGSEAALGGCAGLLDPPDFPTSPGVPDVYLSTECEAAACGALVARYLSLADEARDLDFQYENSIGDATDGYEKAESLCKEVRRSQSAGEAVDAYAQAQIYFLFHSIPLNIRQAWNFLRRLNATWDAIDGLLDELAACEEHYCGAAFREPGSGGRITSPEPVVFISLPDPEPRQLDIDVLSTECSACREHVDRYNATAASAKDANRRRNELIQRLNAVKAELAQLRTRFTSEITNNRIKQLQEDGQRLDADIRRLAGEIADHETDLSLIGDAVYECERQCATIELIDSKNISGNDPFDPRDPLAPETSRIGIDSTGPSVTGGGSQPPPPPEPTVLIINNIPIDRLSVVGPDACPSDHYHGDANNCDGVFTTDPAPLVCGHGIVGSETSIPVSSCPDL